MGRAKGAKAVLEAWDETGAAPQLVAVGFIGCAGRQAMLHALEVDPDFRRRGIGLAMVRAAAAFALEQGAPQLSLLVTRRNLAARSVYERASLASGPGYHYRLKGESPG